MVLWHGLFSSNEDYIGLNNKYPEVLAIGDEIVRKSSGSPKEIGNLKINLDRARLAISNGDSPRIVLDSSGSSFKKINPFLILKSTSANPSMDLSW